MSLSRSTLRRFLSLALAGCIAPAAFANNVEALLEGSLLKVTGDNANNSVLVSRAANGDVTVTGRSGTRVNGRSSVRFPRLQLMSLAVMGWNRSRTLDAQARVAQFRADSKRLLSAMVDPAPNQWNHLLGETNGLANTFLARNSSSLDSLKEDQVQSTLKWLSLPDSVQAQRELVEFCITATALTCGSLAELTSDQRAQLQNLLSVCSGLASSEKATTVMDQLRQLVEQEEGDLQMGYETTIRSLEKQLDAADSHDLQHGLIELLQARSDVRQGQARQAMERLRTIDVHTVPAHLYWMVTGDAQVQLQQLEAAIQAYGLAIGASPKSVAAFVQRAETLRKLRIFKSAEADYSSAIALSPSVSTLYMRRALVRESLGDLSGAINDMDSALNLEPESNRMLIARARLHQLANHREDYIKDFKKGISATPKVVDDWVSRAIAQLPRYPLKAKADLQAALLLETDSLIALQNLAHVESEHLQDMKAAMKALDQILETSPDNETARAGRSVLLARQGLVQECLRDIEVLSKQEIKLLPSTLYQMGCAHALIFKKHENSGESAVRLLALAIRRGYGADIIATDADLDPIRDQVSFAALTTISEFYRAN